MKTVFKGYQILYIDSDLILLYRNFGIYQYIIRTDCVQKVCSIKTSTMKCILSRLRLSNRLLRLSPRCCEKLSNSQYVLSLCNKLWVVNTATCTVSVINTERAGFSTALNLCRCDNKLYWGDYGTNSLYDSVNIYELDERLEMKTVFSFPKGSVRHIHNIIFDRVQSCFWILTGDNEEKAGIYKATKDWKTITSFKNGKQKYRAVVGFPSHGGLIYATDSVEHDNYLYYVNQQGNESMLSPIGGSCIYGGESKDYFLFSTTVESPEGRGIKAMLSTKLGGGIKDRNFHLLAVDKNTLKVSSIKSFRKDIWPYKLLQYGYVFIPSGQNNTNEIWINPMACVGYDGANIKISLTKKDL